MGIPDHLTCHLRKLYTGQEATVRNRHGTTAWFQIWIGVCQGFIFHPEILIPTCALSIPAFCMMYSAYKLNNQGDDIQSWCTPFPIWNQSVVPYLLLTAASGPAHRILRKQIRWSGIPISLRIFHSFSCFFYGPVDVGNLISGSSDFSKCILYIMKFMVHLLLKPSLENFEHYFASMWNECNCAVVWTFFGIAFLWGWNENWPFPDQWPLLSFPNLLPYWMQHLDGIIL